MNEFNDIIYTAIKERGEYKDCRVFYCLGKDLDNILDTDKVQIIFDHMRGFDYKSPILMNPTYLDVAVIANDVINIGDLKNHRYLENVCFVGQKNDVKTYALSFGS